MVKKLTTKKKKSVKMSREQKALHRNVKRRKGKYATKRDQELMFGY